MSKPYTEEEWQGLDDGRRELIRLFYGERLPDSEKPKKKIRQKIPSYWSEKQMLHALVGGFFCYNQNLCIPNVSWGFLPYEADLLVCSSKGWLKEIEIKISLADLKNDSKKRKHENWENCANPIAELYYAMPEPIWEQVKDNPPIPEHAGVIVVYEKKGANIVRHASRQKYARILFSEEREKLARLAHIRYWALSHKEYKNPHQNN